MTDNQSTRTVNTTEILYRLRAANGDLLYVGITRDWPTRMTQHQRDKPWWSEVRFTEMVHIDGTRPQIEAIERAVIKTEAPLHNVQHNGGTAPRVTLGARAFAEISRLPLGREVIMAIGAHEDQPITWQINEADGTRVLLARPGSILHHSDMGWGEVVSIAEVGLWLTEINFGISGGIHWFSLADPDLREQRWNETVCVDHLGASDGIGRLMIGSYCHHRQFGHGAVIQREGQMRFLVQFQGEIEEWIDRTDPEVVRWGQ